MTDWDSDKLVGWILHNRNVNWVAMQLMQGRHPNWLLRACLAHGFSTLVKDVSTHQKDTRRQAYQNTWGMEWANNVRTMANKVAYFVNDSAPAKTIVRLCSFISWCLHTALAKMWTDLFARVATCMKGSSVARLDAVLSHDMIKGFFSGFAHAAFSKLEEVRQKLSAAFSRQTLNTVFSELKEELSVEGAKRLESVADVTAGAWLDALPIVPNRHLGDGVVVCALRYQLGVWPASMQDRPLTCESRKPFSPRQAMRCRCCAGVCTDMPCC
jgi:hypothetical protein